MLVQWHLGSKKSSSILEAEMIEVAKIFFYIGLTIFGIGCVFIVLVLFLALLINRKPF